MPLIKEDGTADHLYASAWTSATTTNKEKALAMATRLIDASWQFQGLKTKAAQALQWPRLSAPNPDTGLDFPSNALPPDLVKATCEMARDSL
jgi:hypothetical protein